MGAADALGHVHAQAQCLANSDRLCCSALTGEEPEQQPATPFNAAGYGEDDEDEEVVVDEDADVPLLSAATPTPFLPARLSMSLGVGVGLGPRWQGESTCHPEEMDDVDEFGKGSGDADDEEEEDEDDVVAAYERTVGGAQHGGRLTKTTTEQIFSPLFETNRPTPVPEAALEELFSDVEASYYDLDSMLTGMQGTAAAAGEVCGSVGGAVGGPKGASQELLESLNSSHSQSLTPTPTPLSSTASCRPDLSELDHIMEIIVGS